VHAQLFVRLIPKFLPEFKERAQQMAQSAEWTGFGGALAGQADAARQALRDKLVAIGTGVVSVPLLRGAIEAFYKAVESV